MSQLALLWGPALSSNPDPRALRCLWCPKAVPLPLPRQRGSCQQVHWSPVKCKHANLMKEGERGMKERKVLGSTEALGSPSCLPSALTIATQCLTEQPALVWHLWSLLSVCPHSYCPALGAWKVPLAHWSDVIKRPLLSNAECFWNCLWQWGLHPHNYLILLECGELA
jgi:hypothetical protein